MTPTMGATINKKSTTTETVFLILKTEIFDHKNAHLATDNVIFAFYEHRFEDQILVSQCVRDCHLTGVMLGHSKFYINSNTDISIQIQTLTYLSKMDCIQN